MEELPAVLEEEGKIGEIGVTRGAMGKEQTGEEEVGMVLEKVEERELERKIGALETVKWEEAGEAGAVVDGQEGKAEEAGEEVIMAEEGEEAERKEEAMREEAATAVGKV